MKLDFESRLTLLNVKRDVHDMYAVSVKVQRQCQANTLLYQQL